MVRCPSAITSRTDAERAEAHPHQRRLSGNNGVRPEAFVGFIALKCKQRALMHPVTHVTAIIWRSMSQNFHEIPTFNEKYLQNQSGTHRVLLLLALVLMASRENFSRLLVNIQPVDFNHNLEFSEHQPSLTSGHHTTFKKYHTINYTFKPSQTSAAAMRCCRSAKA